jgi:hypothetical protein
MAKAILTSMDMSAFSLNEAAINDYNGNTVYEINGMRYSYNLTYISYEPLDLDNFPKEIDDGKTNKPKGTVEKVIFVKKRIEHPKIQIKNPISSLEI